MAFQVILRIRTAWGFTRPRQLDTEPRYRLLTSWVSKARERICCLAEDLCSVDQSTISCKGYKRASIVPAMTFFQEPSRVPTQHAGKMTESCRENDGAHTEIREGRTCRMSVYIKARPNKSCCVNEIFSCKHDISWSNFQEFRSTVELQG